MNFLMVFVGGGLGSICRYGIARWMHVNEWDAPIGTFLANMIACLILGLLIGCHLKSGIEDQIRLLLITGFCGGFSTFSTFSYETFHLLQNGDHINAFANVMGSLLLGVFCVFLGIKIIS